MESIIPVAVVGAGRFGVKHLEKYAANTAVAVVAVVDPDPAAEQLAVRHRARWFRDVEDLPPGLVQAASVAVPNSAHGTVGAALLRAGVDVLVEKPLALDLAEADALIRIANAQGRILQVGHVERFNPAVIAARLPADVRRFRAVRRAPAPLRGERSDVVLDLMVHDIELLIHWTGSVPSVAGACGKPGAYSPIDAADAVLVFAGGCRAVLSVGRGAALRTVRAESNTARIDIELTTPHDALADQLAAFVHAVRHRSEPLVGGAAGRAALAVALGVREHITMIRAHPAA